MRMAREGRRCADGALEAAEFAVDAGQVADDFGDAHDRHVFRAHDALEAGIGHALAAHAEEGGSPPLSFQTLLERGKKQRAVGFAAGFSGGDEDGCGIRHRSAGSRGAENHDSGC